MKKLLLISVSNGSGHVRAAEAVRKTMQQLHPDVTVEHIDMVDYIRLPMKTAVVKSYDLMIKQMPELWGFLYHKTDNATVTNKYHHLSKLMHRMNAIPLYEKITSFQPDYILCTHFLPAQAIFDAPKKYAYHGKLGAVMTDYYNHSFLVHTQIDQYFVATPKLKWLLEQRGIDQEKVTASGIPVDPIFYEKKSILELRTKHGFKPNEHVILVLSGGQGLAKIDNILTELFSLTQPVTLVAIAGSNVALQKKLAKLKAPKHISVRTIGWTNEIDEYMRLADVVITKPGGMTTSECVVLGKPIVAIQPIPGQEEYNAEYILQHHYGQVAHGPHDLVYAVEQALEHPQKNKTAAPESASRCIAETVYKSLSTTEADSL